MECPRRRRLACRCVGSGIAAARTLRHPHPELIESCVGYLVCWHTRRGVRVRSFKRPPWWHSYATMTARLRVVLAEDSYLVREGVRRLLETDPDIDLTSCCVDLDGLLAAVERDRPDVVVTDIRMPPRNT